MHEAGLLAAAVAEALAAGPAPGSGPGSGPAGARRPVGVTVRVHDPMHVSPASAELYAEVALREHGLAGVPITVLADPVTCVVCDAANEVRADHPFCGECGFPLPDHGGHAVEVVVDWGLAANTPVAS